MQSLIPASGLAEKIQHVAVDMHVQIDLWLGQLNRNIVPIDYHPGFLGIRGDVRLDLVSLHGGGARPVGTGLAAPALCGFSLAECLMVRSFLGIAPLRNENNPLSATALHPHDRI